MSPSHNFDPNSNDAVLARVITTLERVEEQLKEGREVFKEHRREIDALKRRQWFAMGAIAAITFGIERFCEWLFGGGGHKP